MQSSDTYSPSLFLLGEVAPDFFHLLICTFMKGLGLFLLLFPFLDKRTICIFYYHA